MNEIRKRIIKTIKTDERCAICCLCFFYRIHRFILNQMHIEHFVCVCIFVDQKE